MFDLNSPSNGGEMTKAELVEEVAKAADLTKKDSEVIVDEVFRNIILALNRGDKIELRGFGSFRVRKRDARRGRNPKTGEPVDIPAKTVPYFKPGKELKELINGKQVGDDTDDDIDDDDDFDNASDNGAGELITG
jgi:integration host factor subunit beta